MFSQFYVLSPRGDSILFRSLRGDLGRSTADTFFRSVRFHLGKPQEVSGVRMARPLHGV